ncbi:hypothetical protein FWF74_01520 [Candidatus Saccharibacteria bacterium]|nr:hypothetical protein [Candidatus Saccharibacteria bacterium]MCL1963090.1 hypothetical protein [Candidatus Saccharibacteria bacterium]
MEKEFENRQESENLRDQCDRLREAAAQGRTYSELRRLSDEENGRILDENEKAMEQGTSDLVKPLTIPYSFLAESEKGNETHASGLFSEFLKDEEPSRHTGEKLRNATLEQDGMKVVVSASTQPGSSGKNIVMHVDFYDMKQKSSPDANGQIHGMGRLMGNYWYNVPEKTDGNSDKPLLRYGGVVVTEEEVGRIAKILETVNKAQKAEQTVTAMVETVLS